MGASETVGRTRGLQLLGFLLATLFLTAVFVGMLAVVSGVAVGIENRLAGYVLVAGLVFVGLIVTLTGRQLRGGTVLLGTTGASMVAGLLVLLAGEGVRYAVLRPAEVFRPQMLAYFATAGLVVVGLTYWTLHFWRDLVSPESPDVVDES